MKTNELYIYTDGGCSGNPGPGGWAFAVAREKNGKEAITTKSGGSPATTNNQMELTAVIEALLFVKNEYKDCRVVLLTDSQYVKNGITNWILNWLKNGWRTSAGKPVKNKEYWIRLKELTDFVSVEWMWVKGHAGVELNELCDSLVRKEMDFYLI